ncbi:hypothetical protein P5G65_32020 [Paenibacillus chondroitinus]|uniref:Transposase n=1 Tax=Paenibacillus chondroitinus TaxID=59842 RepID=A0ABU6DNI0_9BACL|nr:MULTISPECIES: hypothetical protein [Paenibacillus]MCY9661380.1 hypothetical protein [Paenibacillus anseongense]MEB4798543.1 hypothetical protein [Paenibacillus chondroitinus]
MERAGFHCTKCNEEAGNARKSGILGKIVAQSATKLAAAAGLPEMVALSAT